ncbi:hypothetical protein M9458_020750, partial [Cirrhinus mrigala]
SDGHLYKRASSDVFYDDDSDAKPVHDTQTARTNVPAECKLRLHVTSVDGSPPNAPRLQTHPVASSRQTAFHQSAEADRLPAVMRRHTCHRRASVRSSIQIGLRRNGKYGNSCLRIV